MARYLVEKNNGETIELQEVKVIGDDGSLVQSRVEATGVKIVAVLDPGPNFPE